MKPDPEAPFAAAVLIGGRSRRMGRDKAAIRLADGRTLLERQLGLLQALHPDALLVSARPGQGLPDVAVSAQRVEDDGTAGPLGGIVACLRAIAVPRLLVLAVDLPAMTTGILRALLAQPGGAVPQVAGQLQPLAAVYPRSVLPAAEAARATGHLRLTDWVTALAEQGQVSLVPFDDSAPFTNWNRPTDLQEVAPPIARRADGATKTT